MGLSNTNRKLSSILFALKKSNSVNFYSYLRVSIEEFLLKNIYILVNTFFPKFPIPAVFFMFTGSCIKYINQICNS